MSEVRTSSCPKCTDTLNDESIELDCAFGLKIRLVLSQEHFDDPVVAVSRGDDERRALLSIVAHNFLERQFRTSLNSLESFAG